MGIADLVDKVTSILTGPSGPPYIVKKENWFKAGPYGFTATARGGDSGGGIAGAIAAAKATITGDSGSETMFLPINPSNLTITTNFATNIIPTLYGTVEEHSPVRYYDIVIEGTTGIAPKFVSANDIIDEPRKGRTTFDVATGLSDIAGGLFSKTLSVADRIKDQATAARDLINGGPVNKTGVAINETGYLAFHNLYLFLLKYKQDAAGASGSTSKRSKHPLTFFNCKDNNQYDVVVRSFILKRTAENPMLYYYSIVLRGYNLREFKGTNAAALTDDQRLEALGLSGVDGSALFKKFKKVASGVKGILGAAGAGINVLGR